MPRRRSQPRRSQRFPSSASESSGGPTIATLTAGHSISRLAAPDPLARVGLAIWGLLTSVNFAVLQIILLALQAVVGMTLRQLPSFAFRTPSDYAAEMAKIHGRYDAGLGSSVVDVLERLQLFQVFTSTAFTLGLIVLVISIVACTIDRTPRLWRQSADIRVVQPDPFFDPNLPDRAMIAGESANGSAGPAGPTGPAGPAGPTGPAGPAGLRPSAVQDVLRRHHFRVRTAEADGATYVYGDRHRWTKMATLLTHTGLILFLVAAAVTSRLGVEEGLVVPEGQSLTVQPIGTPGLLLVKNFAFTAPGLDTGHPTDFTTDLAVYRDGELIARKVIRVNDPLSVGGYTFHQNGFGAAPDLLIRDGSGGVLWSGPVPMTDSAAGFPFATMTVPGRNVGLQLLLERASDQTGLVLAVPYTVSGTNPDGTPIVASLQPMAIAAGETQSSPDIDFSISVQGFHAYTLLIAKNDPGQGIVWAAFASLISGILITFYLPRRRIWARLRPNGELAIAGRSDRYVDFGREFGRLLDDLVAART
jgi:cytochrome c biogenesis protein